MQCIVIKILFNKDQITTLQLDRLTNSSLLLQDMEEYNEHRTQT